MKNLIFAVVAAGLLVACNGNKDSDKKVDQKDEPAEVTAPAAQQEQDKKPEYPAYDGEYYSVKECKEKIAAASGSACGTCEAIAEFMLSKFSCGAGEVTIDLACTAAEIAFFPEGEPIVAPLCTAFEISFGVLCATYGQQWIDANKHEAAKWMCNKAGLC